MELAHPIASAVPLIKSMDPGESIGRYNRAFQWAHRSASAAHPKKNYGPRRIQRQLHTHMQLADPIASAMTLIKLMDPGVSIGSYSRAFQWAHRSALAAPPK